MTLPGTTPQAASGVSPEAGAEAIRLLIAAYDHLEDLSPDPEFEEPDEELDEWLSDTAALLLRLTGETARALVDRKIRSEIPQ